MALLVAWVPLAALAQALSLRIIRAQLGTATSLEQAAESLSELAPGERARLAVALFGLPTAALAVASFAAGLVVGRWGGLAGPREAGTAGAVAVLLVAALTCASGGWSWAPLAAVLVAAPIAALGGVLGRRRRKA